MKTIPEKEESHTSANMLVYAQDGTEMVFPVPKEQLQVGDLVLLEQGNFIPANTKILTGTITVKDENGQEQIFEPKSIVLEGGFVTEGCAKGYVFY
ncbi:MULTISPECIES: hypothetical protein [Chitinophagaceae]